MHSGAEQFQLLQNQVDTHHREVQRLEIPSASPRGPIEMGRTCIGRQLRSFTETLMKGSMKSFTGHLMQQGPPQVQSTGARFRFLSQLQPSALTAIHISSKLCGLRKVTGLCHGILFSETSGLGNFRLQLNVGRSTCETKTMHLKLDRDPK